MFEIQEMDPEIYRAKTRKATLIVMGMFIVIGFTFAMMFVKWFGEYSSNHLVLNFLGGIVGLMVTATLVKRFFADKPWMAEAMYAWKLKRNLMHITNVIRQVKEAVEAEDENAMKILRFYHLGLTQMHKLDNNNPALIDILAEKESLQAKMEEKGLELNQIQFDPEWVKPFKSNT